jgi:hypothetical protein
MDILENVIAKTTPERGNELKALLFDFLLKEYALPIKVINIFVRIIFGPLLQN